MLPGFIFFVMPVAALASTLVYAPCYVHTRRTQGPQGTLFHLARFALIGCALSLLYLTILWRWPNITFTPFNPHVNLQPFAWLTEGYAMGTRKMVFQLLANIAMFVPYGFLLPVVWPRFRSLRTTALAVFDTTAAIETLQYFIGRSTDVDDVIMNFLGGLLGFGLFVLCRRLFQEKCWWRRMLGADVGKLGC